MPQTLLAALIAVAATNRITSVFAVVAYWLLVWRRGGQRAYAWGGVYALVWLVATLTVRAAIGDGVPLLPVDEALAMNLATLPAAVIAVGGLLAGAWWHVIVNAMRDTLTQRLALFAVLYAVPVAVFGVWHEVRLLIPVLPVLMVIALVSVQDH
jgi:hypothetical protein